VPCSTPGVDRNAAKAATPPKQVKYEPHPLTVEQSKKLLLSVAGHRYEAMFYLALMMGLRRGEVLGLRWSDIDRETLDFIGARRGT
jgi:integrase